MNRTRIDRLMKIVLITSSLAISQVSVAGDWSAGVIGGQSNYDDLGDLCVPQSIGSPTPIEGGGTECFDDDSASYGLNVAYNFDDTFGVEAGYVDLGDFNIGTFSFSPGGPSLNFQDFSVDASVLYAAGTGSLALSDRWSLTGRLGIYEPDVTLRVTGVGEVDDSDFDSDLYVGVSIDYSLSDRWTAQLRYDDFDIDVTSLGLKYTFR